MSEPDGQQLPQDTLFSKFFGLVDATQLSTDSGIAALQAIFVPIFDEAVDSLRDPSGFPNRRINMLANLLWSLIEHKVVLVGMSPSVPTIHFWMEVKNDHRFAAVVAPPTWPQHVLEDPWMALGGIVNIASQACDYYNSRFESSDIIMERAYAQEAEFYHTVVRIGSKHGSLHVSQEPDDQPRPFEPNQYQLKVMQRYPKGIVGLDFIYPLKPFLPGEFDSIERAIIRDN